MNTTPDNELDFGEDLDVAPAPQAAAPAPEPAAPTPPTPPTNELPQTVPYGRFAQVNAERKQAEAAATAARDETIRLQERIRMLEQERSRPIEERQPEKPAVDLNALYNELDAAYNNMDSERSSAVRAKISAEEARRQEARDRMVEERAVARFRAEAEAERAKAAEKAAADAAAADLQELQKTAIEVVTKYPFLNSTIDGHDKEAIKKVDKLRSLYISGGASQTEALRLAIDVYAEIFDARAKPSASADPTRNARAAAAQPPSLNAGKSTESAGAGTNLDRDQFYNLPKEEQQKLLA